MKKANRKLALHSESLYVLDGSRLVAGASAPPACTASCGGTCGNIPGPGDAANALIVTKAACCV